jgi:predicted nucleic acid-binding protein
LRVVFDTNVIISAMLFEGSKPSKAFDIGIKERGRNNFLNYASQLEATFARSQIPKASK